MLARDIMQGPVEDVMPSDDIYLASSKMRQRNVHHLPVVNTQSQLIGIISDRDVLRSLSEVANSDAAMPLVSDCMHTEVVTCHEEDSLHEIADKILHFQINCLPVVNDERICVGMVSSRDIIRATSVLGRRLADSSSESSYAKI